MDRWFDGRKRNNNYKWPLTLRLVGKRKKVEMD